LTDITPEQIVSLESSMARIALAFGADFTVTSATDLPTFLDELDQFLQKLAATVS
jgi:hypothetical protein